ncbi:hypothetical protein LTR27_012470 [Elasticomyces elasticus]|nr:hypothetical protein LTR27_012470 [Elasticomyces elasticus]
MAKRAAEDDEQSSPQALKAGERPVADDGVGEGEQFEDEFEDEYESEDEVLEAGVDGRPDEEREADERASGAMDVDRETFIPGRHKLDAGQTLAPDLSTYEMLHTLEPTWPCLSFDVLRDGLGDDRKSFPATVYAVAGTQAARGREKENNIMVMKLSGLSRNDQAVNIDSDDEDDDEVESTEPILETKTIPLTSTTNRIRAHQSPQASSSAPATTLTAAMQESGDVLIHDVTPYLSSFDTPGYQIPTTASKPLSTIRAHKKTEGYALDWSPLVPAGKLLTGDSAGQIYATTRTEGGGFMTDTTPYNGHSSSIEELQWSPNERNVFASASSDGTVRIWDARSKARKHAISVKVSSSDANVLSWSHQTPHLLASGHDDGTWSVWDLRQWKTPDDAAKSKPVAHFDFHKEQITSLEWHPTDDSIVSVCAGDNTLTLWDLAVELDDEESRYTADVKDVPPQLLFVHYMDQVKEAHWHKQMPGVVMATGGSGFGAFKTISVSSTTATMSSVPVNPTSHNVASILGKLTDADPDIRYMTLNDLNRMMENGAATFLIHDYTTCAKVVDGLLHTLNDSNGDVQNMSVTTLGSFVKKAPESILCPTIEKVSSVKTTNSIDTTMAATAVRAIVVNLPHPVPGAPRGSKVQEAYSAVSKALIPRLTGKVVIPLPKKPPGEANPQPPKGMLDVDMETGNDSNTLDLLTEVAKCFGSMLQESEVQALEQITLRVLESEKCGTVMKKKAVGSLSALAPYFTDGLLAHHVSYTIEQLRSPHVTPQQRKLYLQVYSSLARSIPQKFGPYLKTLAPFVLSPLSQQELDQQREEEAEAEGERDAQIEEVREAALVAIESFLQACAPDMRAYTKDVVETSTRFLKYDPNVADEEDEDMEEEQEDEDVEVDEDFEEETGFEDEDDVSWKVRRCSAKVLHALIDKLDPNDAVVYGQIAPALIARFKEREESVRNEVIATLAYLVAKTGHVSGVQESAPTSHNLAPTRKRRRGFSDSLGSDSHAQGAMNGYASPSTPPPTDNATMGLARINPEVIKGAAKLLKTSTVPTKQAVIALLKDMVTAQKGGLSEHADHVVDPVVETIASSTNTGGNTLRIEVLQLLRVIADSHSSKVIQPFLDKIVPTLVKSAKDRFAKVSSEAFATIESYIKSLTPPRSAASKSQNGQYLSQFHQVITERISATDTDTEVRQKAVQALGLLVGRTSGTAGSSLLGQQDRYAGQTLIAERLRNELTRLACVRAVDMIAVLAQSKKDFKPDWVSTVALELGAQFNKSSRSLRGASLSALRMLAINQASRECMDDNTISQLVNMLVSLLRPDDLHMLGPALIVLGAFAKERPALVATQPVVDSICLVVTSSVSGTALDALVACVEAIGQAGAGKGLMKALLDVGVKGQTDVTGQVIGTLLVAGGNGVGVKLQDFVKELQTQPDEAKKCLALSVLGEASLRMGTSGPLKPNSFTPHFTDNSDKVKLSAAVALGRAGAGNVTQYLPSIINMLGEGTQYLLLHSVKELLQHSNAEEDIRPYAQTLWQNIISSGQAADNKVVGAECVGRLAIIDPAAYLPQLQNFLQNPNPAIRGMVISALRYVFSDTDETYDSNLRASIIPMLGTMLSDGDLDNQRLSLTTFNSALHNKPGLVLPHLQDVLPYAMQATVIRPELVREVQMGPFKHKVDDGLEMRKSAYETLYTLLDTPASRQRLDISSFYERIVAGITDEHEIKILCCLVLSKLLVISPAESTRRLDALAQNFRAVLAFKPKDSAVKQELEKLSEEQKAVVKVTVVFNKALAATQTKTWKDYNEWVRKDFVPMVKAAEDDLKGGAEY